MDTPRRRQAVAGGCKELSGTLTLEVVIHRITATCAVSVREAASLAGLGFCNRLGSREAYQTW